MAKALAILGTGSDVGKSLLATGICRLLVRAGYRVAPFKAQNMSLNSFVTFEGGEMGRAQVLQAQACGVEPQVDMNPILLKPETDQRSQVIVQGTVWERRGAKEYGACRDHLFEMAKSSYERLANQYPILVIEGAGSAAELNLRDRDFVNWPMVEMADAAVILVADIDRGGVFAQVIGTLDLLAPEERRRVIGVVVNKFRGDLELFRDGVRILEQRTNVPVLGVVPFARNVGLDQEDSVTLDPFRSTPFTPETVNVAVMLLPHMSNFTDFNQLAAEPDVAFRYAAIPSALQGADVVIIPGSKTTIADLEYVRSQGFDRELRRSAQQGAEVVGICGGLQMLGETISDKQGIETGGEARGLGFLPFDTDMLLEKRTVRVRAWPLHLPAGVEDHVDGYEIHVGVTRPRIPCRPCFLICSAPDCQNDHARACPPISLPNPRESQGAIRYDGIVHEHGAVWGTYLHGVFDRPGFRRLWLNRIRARKGLLPLGRGVSDSVSNRLAGAIDRWADHVGAHLNLGPILSVVASPTPGAQDRPLG